MPFPHSSLSNCGLSKPVVQTHQPTNWTNHPQTSLQTHPFTFWSTHPPTKTPSQGEFELRRQCLLYQLGAARLIRFSWIMIRTGMKMSWKMEWNKMGAVQYDANFSPAVWAEGMQRGLWRLWLLRISNHGSHGCHFLPLSDWLCLVMGSC